MLTRLKSGAIKGINYAALVAACPQLQFLQIIDEEPFIGGYSFVFEISDVLEPSIFQKSATIPQWKTTMQEEYDSLKA